MGEILPKLLTWEKYYSKLSPSWTKYYKIKKFKAQRKIVIQKENNEQNGKYLFY